MDDALVVRELQRVANLRHDGQRLAWRDAPGVEQLPQRHAVHKFHEEKIEWHRHLACVSLIGISFDTHRRDACATTNLPKFIQRHDAGMIQFCQRLGFAGEASGKRGVAADAGRKNFQGDNPVQFLLADFIDRAHAALADEFQNFELRELPGQFLRFGRNEARRFFRARRRRRRSGTRLSSGTRGRGPWARWTAAACRSLDKVALFP